MSHGYSLDFRIKVLDFLDRGGRVVDACNIFGIGRTTIFSWRQRKEKTGDVRAKDRPKKAYKFCEQALANYVDKHPDAYLSEIAQVFNMTPAGICVALKRLKITRKKRLRYTKKEMS